MVSQRILGILFGVGAGAMWALEAILGKLLFPTLTFVQVTASEVFFAALTVLTYMLARGEKLRLPGKNLWSLLLLGLLGSVLAPLLYFFGLTQTNAVNATLIAHLQPLFVATFGVYFLKERLHRHDFIGGSLIIFAAILITSRTADNLIQFKIGNFGDLMVFFAMLSWAVIAIPGKRLTRETSSVVITGYRFLIASIVFLPVLSLLNELVLTSVYQVLLGVLVGLGYIFYYEGLRRIKAGQVALTELSSPLFAAVLAWYIFGETVTPLQVVGSLILICGLYVLTREKPRVESSR